MMWIVCTTLMILSALPHLALAQEETCSAAQTPPDAIGPFFVANTPIRRELAPAEQLNDPSLRLEVSGTIYGNDCVPMSSALVEVWYAGVLEGGVVDYSDGTTSNDFRGQIITDECGRYDFVATVPESYAGRPIIHIHFRVSNDVQVFLNTQMYFSGLIIPGFNPADNQILQTTTGSDGTRSGVFDITLNVAGTANVNACDAGTEEPEPSTNCPDGLIPIGDGSCACFPASAQIETLEKGKISMDELKIGDKVKVSADRFEPVYSFGHKQREGSFDFLVINGRLHISASHMVAVDGNGFVPASIVAVGDKLVLGNGSTEIVHVISKATGNGLYAPFTTSGTIVVDGVMASSYITLQENSSQLILPGGYVTGLTWQSISHAFLFPYRLRYYYSLDQYKGYEEYSPVSGISTRFEFPYKAAMWLLQQSNPWSFAAWIPMLVTVSFFSVLEWTMKFPIVFSLFLSLTAFIAATNGRRFVKEKTV